MKSKVPVTLQLEHCVVTNNLFLKYVCIRVKKTQIFLLSTFDQCEVLKKYSED